MERYLLLWLSSLLPLRVHNTHGETVRKSLVVVEKGGVTHNEGKTSTYLETRTKGFFRTERPSIVVDERTFPVYSTSRPYETPCRLLWGSYSQ